MADPINLNRVRKARARAEKDALAAENRAGFGRSKAERQKAAAEKSLVQKMVDAHKRDTP